MTDETTPRGTIKSLINAHVRACFRAAGRPELVPLHPGPVADTIIAAWNTRPTQTADVVEARTALANIANTINVVGSPLHKALDALDELVADVKRQARSGLKTKAALSHTATSEATPTPDSGLAGELAAQEVRTEVVNLDNGETGKKTICISIDMRDRILTALARIEQEGGA